MRSKQLFLSVVIPLFNEEYRTKNIVSIINYLSAKHFTWELVLANDGSTDKTLRQIRRFQNDKIKVLSYPHNRGKGYAVKSGMLMAVGKHRLFLDIDLATPISEFDKFIPLLGTSDILIGTRKGKGSVILVHQPWLRETLGKCFTLISRLILGVSVSDFTCGFKCFTGMSAKKVFELSVISRWGFDSEILYLGKRNNLSILEVPIVWQNDSRTRVRFPQDLIRSFVELISIRINSLRGIYE